MTAELAWENEGGRLRRGTPDTGAPDTDRDGAGADPARPAPVDERG